MNRIPALLLALACWLSAGAVRAALTDPAQIQTEAYVNLVQADQSLDAGRLDEALAQYNAARDYYQQLAKDFPGWEPRVIQYRKTYCDNQITDVERRLNGGQPEELPELAPEPTTETRTPAPAPPKAARPEAPRSPAPERAIEIDYLKSRIASLEAEVADFDTVQNELDSLAEQNDKLRKDLDSANQQLAKRADAEQSARKELQDQLEAKVGQIQILEKEIEAKKQLDQALNDMEGKVNELRAQNERLDKEVKTLDQELDAAEVRADESSLQAKQAEEDLKQARDEKAAVEQQLAMLQRKPIFEKPARKQDEPKPENKPPLEPQSEKVAEAVEPAVEESAPATSPAKALVPPKPIPNGMSTADYVRKLLQEDDNDSALATVRAAREAAPTDMNLALIEGIALIRLQRYSEAASMLIDLARSNPRNAEIHATLGAAMMGNGLYEEARETLLKAAKLDNNLPECQYNLAQLYAFVDPIDLKQARKYYKQARDLGLAADPQLDKALK
jgi:tetratricopeptide (TPR) repeat protein